MPNRVKEIREILDVKYLRHIPGKENIAHLPSCGFSAKKLLDSQWCCVPNWLDLSPDEWPSTELPPEEELVDGEKKKLVTVTSTTMSHAMKFLRISSYPRIPKSISVWLHLKMKLSNLAENQDDFSSAAALKGADINLILFVQEDFRRDP